MSRVLIICALLACAVATAGAEPLTLRDAIRTGLDNNNRLKAARFSSQAAQQGVTAATSRYLPVIAFEETLVASNSPLTAFMMKLDESRFNPAEFATPNAINHPSARHDFKTDLSLQQPLFVPALAPLKELAVADARKAELDLEAARQDVAFQVFHAYLAVQRAVAGLKAADQAVADARENMRLATVRTASGVGLKSDELRSRTHLSQVEQLRVTAGNNVTLSRMKLAQLAGLPEDASYEVSALLETVTVPEMTEQVVAGALRERVEIRRSRADVDGADAALRLARSGYLPTVGAFASYQLNAKDAPFASDNDAWTAGVSLKWNIFDGFRTTSERQRALSGQSAAREMLESTTRDVRYQVRESFLRRDEAAKHREATHHSLQDAEETVRLLGKRYENSLATMAELLDAQTALNQARANLVESETGYALASGQIYYMTGTFVKEILQ